MKPNYIFFKHSKDNNLQNNLHEDNFKVPMWSAEKLRKSQTKLVYVTSIKSYVHMHYEIL